MPYAELCVSCNGKLKTKRKDEPQGFYSRKYNAFKLSNFEICASVLALILLLQLTGFIVQSSILLMSMTDYFSTVRQQFYINNAVCYLVSCIIFFREKFGFLIIFIAGGAISNIVDRLIYGGSIDYIAIGNFPFLT